jgi:hypothetical protein
MQALHANKTPTLPSFFAQYSVKAQAPLPTDISPKLSPEEIKEIQCIIGNIFYFMVLMALSSIATDQSKGTMSTMTMTMAKAKQFLDHLTTYPDAAMRFRALYMIMNAHSYALYLFKSDPCSRACGHFFMGWSPKDGHPIRLNGTFFFICNPLNCHGFGG